MRQEKNKQKNRRVRLIACVCLITVIAAITAYLLWIAHLNRLHVEMESRLKNASVLIEEGAYNDALTEAGNALELAERLRDDEAIEEIDRYIRLAESVLRGDDLFLSGSYQAAQEAYMDAIDYAAHINDLNKALNDEKHINMHLVIEKLTTTQGYVFFYILVEYAQELADIGDYYSALTWYEKARLEAVSLSYQDGVRLAVSGMDEMQEQINIAKRDEAVFLYSQGELHYNGKQYAQALEFFYDALTLFTHINDRQGMIMTKSRIEFSEHKLAEAQQQAEQQAEQQAPPDSPPQEDNGDQNGPLTNYEHNINISFDMNVLIDNQNQRPANQIRMGTTEGMNEGWYNGCGWVATYNALILLGVPEHPAQIVNHFETSGGTVFGGMFGTYPNAIEAYLKDRGYNVTQTLFPQITKNIDEEIKNSRVSILAYLHTRAAHYITIVYREDIDRFIVYNDSFARTRSAELDFQNDTDVGAAIDSVAALIRSTPNIIFSFSLITVG